MHNSQAMPDRPRTQARIITGAALGMAIGFAPLFVSTSGVFMSAVTKEFGWGRAAGASSFSAAMLGLTIACPIAGVLMDKFGARKVILLCAIVFAALMACMGLQTGNFVAWVSLSLLIGMAGAATTVLGYLAILPYWFDRRLGLAIGVAMLGLGLGTVGAPPLAHALIATFGWRSAYQAFALISLAGSLGAWWLLAPKPSGQQQTAKSRHGEGASVLAAHSSWKVFLIFLAAFLASAATLSLNTHLPGLLASRGVSGGDAARALSLLGTGILCGRFISGLLLDRIHAPIVGCLFFLAGAAGFFMLEGAPRYPSALLACVFAGLAIGAEGDLLSYLVRTYAGLKNFGRNYGIAFAGYGLGAVLGPLATGRYLDIAKNYTLPLQVAPCLLALAGVLLLCLGRYPRARATSALHPQVVHAR